MDLQLQGRRALVLGGHGTIGSAVVARLRAEGAVAIAASRTSPDGIVMDATDDDSVAAGIARFVAEHGRIEIVVVSAAPSARTLDPARNGHPAQVLAAMDAKAMSFLRVANAVLPSMVDAGDGRIIGVSGQNAFITGNITGAVRNAALNIAAKSLADSVAGSGVTVNTVNPGLVSEHPASGVEIGKGGESTPAQIADLIAFLASPLAAAISGESIATGHRVRGASGMH